MHPVQLQKNPNWRVNMTVLLLLLAALLSVVVRVVHVRIHVTQTIQQ